MTGAIATLVGCEVLGLKESQSDPPAVISVSDQTVPQLLDAGEPAPFPGVLLSKPLFNELVPCFERPETWRRADEPDVPPDFNTHPPAGLAPAEADRLRPRP